MASYQNNETSISDEGRIGVLAISHGLVLYLTWYFMTPLDGEDQWYKWLFYGICFFNIFLFGIRSGFANTPTTPRRGILANTAPNEASGPTIFIPVAMAFIIYLIHHHLWPWVQLIIAFISYKMFGVAPFVDL